MRPRARPRLGVAGKILLGFAVAALLPLALSLIASVAAFSRLSDGISAELLREKARSARLLLAARLERIHGALALASRDNAVLVNYELGLDRALAGHLSGLASVLGLDALWIEDQGGSVFAWGGAVPRTPLDGLPPQDPGAPARVVPWRDQAYLLFSHPLAARDGGAALRAFARAASSLGPVAAELERPVLLLDRRGAVLSASVEGGPAALPLEPGRGPRAEARGDLGGVAYVFGADELRSPAGGALGLVAVGYPLAELVRTRDEGILSLLAAFSAAILVSALASLHFSRTIARPVRLLAGAAREISGGKYGQATRIALDDEIGELAREFDAMSLVLAEQHEQREIAEEALRQSEAQFRSIFDGVSEAIFVHEMDRFRIVDANLTAARMFGYPHEKLSSMSVGEMSAAEEGYDDARAAALLERARAGEEPRSEWKARRSDGSVFWVEVALRQARIGGESRILVTCRDIGERKAAEAEIARALREKELLLKEVHHRVKNNFQIIDSLFDLQESATRSPELAGLLRDPRSRIHAMALVHEHLYQNSDFASIDFGDYVAELGRGIYAAYNVDHSRIGIEIRAESIALDIDRAIPCGLILNELLTNALKYAFPADDPRSGKIVVELRSRDGRILLAVSDDGVGYDGAGEPTAGDGFAAGLGPGLGPGPRKGSLGLTLVEILAKQVKGRLRIETGAGTRVEIDIPVSA